MEIFSNHTRLFTWAFVFFVSLSILVAIIPAIQNQHNNAPLPMAEQLSGDALAGKKIFIENGCVACHTQQVRNIAMDNVWGERPSVAADYATSERMSVWMNSATLMGTERTGPDLTNIGSRLPSSDWHLLHLYNPRAVVEESIMPAYPWLFEHKTNPAPEEKIVSVPDAYLKKPGTRVVAKQEALQLVAYLQSLKQVPLTANTPTPEFLYKNPNQKNDLTSAAASAELDGASLYASNCQACHQANGEGLPGAFPSLKGSRIILDPDPKILVEIILKGYNARDDFGEMPAIGTMNKLTDAEIAAIISHERTSWGNNAGKVEADEVTKIRAFIENEVNQ